MAARPLRIAILAIVAFAAGLILARALMPARVAVPQTERATVLPGARPLPALSLTNQDGSPLGPDFFKGGWTIVFFGFTTCPDICPTTLATLSAATRQLSDLPRGGAPARPADHRGPGARRPGEARGVRALLRPGVPGCDGRREVRRRSGGGVRRSVRPRQPARRRLHDGPRIRACSSSPPPERSRHIRQRRTMRPCWRGITARSSPQREARR